MVSQSPRGRLVIISAPSGGGKTTIINKLLAGRSDRVHSVSWTTRPPRPGRVDEGYYRIVDRETFEKGVDNGELVEHAEVHNHLYGTPKEPLEHELAEGRDVLLDLDVIGALKLKEHYGERALLIFLVPPSMDELNKRLTKRATDSAEVQRIRLENAFKEVSYKKQFDYRIVNDTINRACEEIEELLESGSMEVSSLKAS